MYSAYDDDMRKWSGTNISTSLKNHLNTYSHVGTYMYEYTKILYVSLTHVDDSRPIAVC